MNAWEKSSTSLAAAFVLWKRARERTHQRDKYASGEVLLKRTLAETLSSGVE